jgi:hypothetical protein
LHGFGLKKNLTEINHKVNDCQVVLARNFALFAAKCVARTQAPDIYGNCREAVMQEAFVGSWAGNSQLSAGNLGSLRDLNHRFLDLAAARGRGWEAGAGVPLELAGRVATLSAVQREAAASCPYALFDLRFQDDRYWRHRLQSSDDWRVADESIAADDTVSFVRLALFYAWHICASAGLTPQLILGMNGDTAAEFRRLTVNQLSPLAVTEAANLSARWSECAAFWSALTAAASRTDPMALRRVQLRGLQLAAAARLHYRG